MTKRKGNFILPRNNEIPVMNNKIKVNKLHLETIPMKSDRMLKDTIVHAVFYSWDTDKYYFARKVKVCKYVPFIKVWDIDTQPLTFGDFYEED